MRRGESGRRKSWDGSMEQAMVDEQLQAELNHEARKKNAQPQHKISPSTTVSNVYLSILFGFVVWLAWNICRDSWVAKSPASLPIDIMDDLFRIDQLTPLLDSTALTKDLPHGITWAGMGMENMAILLTHSKLKSRHATIELLYDFAALSKESMNLVLERNAAADVAIRSLLYSNEDVSRYFLDQESTSSLSELVRLLDKHLNLLIDNCERVISLDVRHIPIPNRRPLPSQTPHRPRRRSGPPRHPLANRTARSLGQTVPRRRRPRARHDPHGRTNRHSLHHRPPSARPRTRTPSPCRRDAANRDRRPHGSAAAGRLSRADEKRAGGGGIDERGVEEI